MSEAYIVEAVRTPVGRRNGGLAAIHPADLAAHTIREVVARADVDPAAIDDVVLGCLDQIGAQAGDVARTAALAAGLPEHVPGVTIDRQVAPPSRRPRSPRRPWRAAGRTCRSPAACR